MKQVDIKFEVNGKPIKFSILSDIGSQGELVIMSWATRAKSHTAKSLCSYINKKGLHKASLITESKNK